MLFSFMSNEVEAKTVTFDQLRAVAQAKSERISALDAEYKQLLEKKLKEQEQNQQLKKKEDTRVNKLKQTSAKNKPVKVKEKPMMAYSPPSADYFNRESNEKLDIIDSETARLEAQASIKAQLVQQLQATESYPAVQEMSQPPIIQPQIDLKKITAMCRDGTYSTATIDNACFNNGGVASYYHHYHSE